MSIELLLVPIAIAVVHSIGRSRREQLEPTGTFCIDTRFKDSLLLEAALSEIGCTSVTKASSVDTAIGGAQIGFERNEDGVFEAWFRGNIAIPRAQAFISAVDEAYVRLVQQQVYRRLLERAHERGLLLESEQVLDDNSVLLTFAI